MSETAAQEKEATKQEPEVLGFYTHDKELVTLPFYQLKEMFSILKAFERPVATMHMINDMLMATGQSKPFYEKDTYKKDNDILLKEEFVKSCEPKAPEKKDNSVIVTDLTK